jgi:amino acid transporter
MTPTLRPGPERSAVAMALARNRLGVPSVMFFVLAEVGPLLVVAGVVPTFFAVTGLTGAPIFFLVVAVILAIFAVGYIAMSRKILNAGAFYAFTSRGLGRPFGVATAMVAVVAYNLLQVGLYGIFGPTMHDYAIAKFHIHMAWWAWALVAWLLTAILGIRDVRLSAQVLAVLTCVEILVILALSVAGLAHPAGGHVDFSTLAPKDLFVHGVGAAGVVAVLGFIGFEGAPVFAEEARDHRRTVATATYLTLGLIGVVYVASTLAMTMHYGAGNVVKTAQQEFAGMVFGMSNNFLNQSAQVLFLTSLFAAMIGFHNAVGRYMFSLGRETVLPSPLGRTGRRSGAPIVASLTQSFIGLAVIVIYAVAGWDPLIKLFFWLGTTGGFGVLIMLAVTSMAIIGYFGRDPQDETIWPRAIAPAIAAILLTTMVVLAVINYSTLLGTPSGALANKVLPSIYLAAAVIGFLWAAVLRTGRRHVYDAIGMGANVAMTRPTSHAATL